MSRWGPSVLDDNPYPYGPQLSGGQQFLQSFTDTLLSAGERKATEEKQRLDLERERLQNQALSAALTEHPAERARQGAQDVIDAVQHGFRSPLEAANAAPVETPKWDVPALPADATPTLPHPTPDRLGFQSPGIPATHRPAAASQANAFADAIDERDATVMGRPQVTVGGQSLVYSPEAVNEELWGRPSKGSNLTFEQRMALQGAGSKDRWDLAHYQEDQKNARADALIRRSQELMRQRAILVAKGQESTDAWRATTVELQTIAAQTRLLGIDLGIAGALAPSDVLNARLKGRTQQGAAEIQQGGEIRGNVSEELQALRERLNALENARRGGDPAARDQSTVTPPPPGIARPGVRTAAPLVTDTAGQVFTPDAVRRRRQGIR